MAFDGTLKFDTAIDQSGFKTGISNLGSIAKAGMAAVTTAVTAAAGAMVVLGKNALDAYADYEQLTGGVSTLFGAQDRSLEEYAASVGKSVDAARGEYDKLMQAQTNVMDNASKAFKTAGLSQNEYMETVTSFSAALVASLGGDTLKAAEVADKAIIDMADNANKMGSSMESIQNAYQGFAKQNYTMLDNLKLGYGGTKSEMERLLADAEAISGVHYDIESYADIVEAIHIIQDEMGVTGTTAKEAAETISGSVAAMGSAWDNLVVGIADDNQAIEPLISDFIESAATAAENILPRVGTIIDGMSELADSFSGILAKVVTEVVSYVPDLIEAATSLVSVLVDGLIENAPILTEAVAEIAVQIVGAISDIAPELMVLALDLIASLAQGLAENLPQLISAAEEGLAQLIEGIKQNLPVFADAGISIILTLAEAFVDSLPTLLDAGLAIVSELAQALLDNLPEIIASVGRMIDGWIDYIAEGQPKVLEVVQKILTGIVDALPELLGALTSALPGIIKSIIEMLTSYVPQFLKCAINLFTSIVDALPEIVDELSKNLPDIVMAIVTALVEAIPQIASASVEMFMAIVDSLPEVLVSLTEALGTLLSNIGEALGEVIIYSNPIN